MPAHVFISYGRLDAAAFVARLCTILNESGFVPFIDTDGLRTGEAWDEGLAEAIDTAEAVIAVLSPHAVRRTGDAGNADNRDSVCLDELVRARAAGRRILPVMIERCDVPLPIARLNYIDMVGWQSDAGVRRAGEAALLAALRDGAAIAEAAPATWDFSSTLAARTQGFTGRAWLFDQVDAWLATARGGTLLLLGPPGIGKSAFSAELIRRDAGRRVVAHHLFQAETPATREPGRFVRGLAAQLARSVPGYAAAMRAPETRRLLYPSESDGDPASAFEGAILAPLLALAPPASASHAPASQGSTCLILLDALDEALSTGPERQSRSLLDLLAARLDRLPPWLCVLATSRPDPAALRGFEAARRLRLDEIDDRNRADLDAWLAGRLPAAVAARLAQLANGSFLYARLATEALANPDMAFDLEDLPPRLTGLFSRFFSRSFQSEAAYAPARRVLSVMLATREPVSEAILSAIAGLGAREVRAVFDALAPYLDRNAAVATLHHKALADWLADTQDGDPMFLVDRADGASRLLDWCRSWPGRPADDYSVRHLAAHLAAAGQVDELRALLEDGRFHAARQDDPFARAEDWAELASALLAAGDDSGAGRLTVTADAMRREAVAGAIARAGLPAGRLGRVIAAMTGPDAAGQAARVAALRLAARAGLAGPLLDAVQSDDMTMVSVAVPEAYRLWRDHREAGWAAFEQILARIPNWAGVPRGAAVNVAAGFSFGILTREMADPVTLARLGAAWRTAVGALQKGLAARIIGRFWVRAALKPLLRALMAGQPDYQPLNYAEIQTAFARPPGSHAPALEIIDCLDDLSRGSAVIADVLCQPGLKFDVHLMLAAERALVRHGAGDTAGTFATLSRLMAAGPAWFHQSILYSGFHVLSAATDPSDDWISAYGDWAYATLGPSRATLRTDTRTYQLVPHMAWPMVVLHRHGRAAEGRFIAAWLAQAETLGDMDFARRALGAAEVLSFVYQLDALALEALRDALARDRPQLRGDMIRTLANIRFNAGALVDNFLQQLGRADLLARVAVTPPTFSMRDYPTWIDAFFNRLLVTNDAFRAEVVDIFRRTGSCRSAGELLSMAVDWVVHLLEGGMESAPPGRQTSGAAPGAAWRAGTPR